MKDQYNVEIPLDLVILPDISCLTVSEIELVDSVSWYEITTFDGCVLLAASARGIHNLSDEEILLIDIENIDYVGRVLHRYNKTDGFYHA